MVFPDKQDIGCLIAGFSPTNPIPFLRFSFRSFLRPICSNPLGFHPITLFQQPHGFAHMKQQIEYNKRKPIILLCYLRFLGAPQSPHHAVFPKCPSGSHFTVYHPWSYLLQKSHRLYGFVAALADISGLPQRLLPYAFSPLQSMLIDVCSNQFSVTTSTDRSFSTTTVMDKTGHRAFLTLTD